MGEESLQRPEPGKRIGNYVLREFVGRGAFAEVWKAEHQERPDCIRALKIAASPEYRRQLQREGRLPDIRHPNVVPILDSDTRFADVPYIVLPFVDGGNLRDLLAKHREGLPEERVELLLRDILNGLSAAHKRGIVHRDLKPHNILLDSDGRALITDFGLSLANTPIGSTESLRQSLSVSTEATVTIAGSLAYMAPEVRDGEPAALTADIFSIGVILFEMFTGRRPVGPEVPSDYRKDLKQSSLWDRLYRKCCCPIQGRYADAGTMLVAFEKSAETSDEEQPKHSGGAHEQPSARKTVYAQPDSSSSAVRDKETADSGTQRVSERPDNLGAAHVKPREPSAAVPASNDLWTSVLDTWKEYRQLCDAIARPRQEIEQALQVYEDKHPIVRELRMKLVPMQNRMDILTEKVVFLCEKIDDKLAAKVAPILDERETLISEGCRPSHPRVRELDARIRPYDKARKLVGALRDKDEDNELRTCLED